MKNNDKPGLDNKPFKIVISSNAFNKTIDQGLQDAYDKYWKDELHKLKHGTTINGKHISGLAYYCTRYLNPPLLSTRDIDNTKYEKSSDNKLV